MEYDSRGHGVQLGDIPAPSPVRTADGRALRFLRHAGGRLLVIGSAVLYGVYAPTTTIIFTRARAPTIATVSFARALIIGACFIPVLLRALALHHWALTPALVLSAVEVAAYDVGMMSLLNLGLGLNGSPTKCAFLLQSSILFTPCLSAAAGRPVPRRAWLGSMLALAGAVLVTTSETRHAAPADAPTGAPLPAEPEARPIVEPTDLIFVCAAFLYSLYVFRQGALVQSGEPERDTWLRQALCNLFSLVPFAAWFGAEMLATGRDLREQWPGIGSLHDWVLVVLSALSVGVVGQTMQAIGQRRTPTVEANIILATEPLWATLFAMTLLGELLSPSGWCGGALMLVACFIGAPFCGAAPIGPASGNVAAKVGGDKSHAEDDGATSSSAASVDEADGGRARRPASRQPEPPPALEGRHSLASQH